LEAAGVDREAAPRQVLAHDGRPALRGAGDSRARLLRRTARAGRRRHGRQQRVRGELGGDLVSTKSVREALAYVAARPVATTAPIDTPCWELVGRTLFKIANSPDAKVRGSMARATKAQKLIA